MYKKKYFSGTPGFFIKLLFIMVLFFAVSCVNNKKNQNTTFNITINLEISNDDKIQIFYIPKGDSVYRDTNLITHKIKGSNNPVELKFSLPNIPEKFRIDLGEEKIESPVKINQITLKAFDKIINIDGKTVNRFFKPNIFLIETSKINLFLRQAINCTYDPFMESTPLLHKKIQLEIMR